MSPYYLRCEWCGQRFERPADAEPWIAVQHCSTRCRHYASQLHHGVEQAVAAERGQARESWTRGEETIRDERLT